MDDKHFPLVILLALLWTPYSATSGISLTPQKIKQDGVGCECAEALRRHYCSTICVNISAAFVRGRIISRPSLLYSADPNNDKNRNTDSNDSSTPTQEKAIRLNKVFKATHSRREADRMIQSGRVTVNGGRSFTMPSNYSKSGTMVVPYRDTVELDGKVIVGWEKINGFNHYSNALEEHKDLGVSQHHDMIRRSMRNYEYIKYWKPKGIICTTDRSIKCNIIEHIISKGYNPPHRFFPVGRLDKDSTGLILLTSDGRVPNAVLRGNAKKAKTYVVTVDRPIRTANDIQKLRRGVVITTTAQRDGKRKEPQTAKTRPCEVTHISHDKMTIQMTIQEGKNRQIRKMLESLNYTVVKLHRTDFCGVLLSPLKQPGEWKALTCLELQCIAESLKVEATAATIAQRKHC